MKRVAIICLLAGVALTLVLIARSEMDDIVHAFTTLGLHGFGLLIAVHLCLIALMGLAWGVLFTDRHAVFIWGRLVRDGAAEVLPLSQIGGFVLGARAMVLVDVPLVSASASTVVDVTLELLAQLVYTVMGLILLAWLRPGSDLELPAVIAVVTMAALAGLFIVAQKRGVGPVERMLSGLSTMLLGQRPAVGGSLRAAICEIHRNPRRLSLGAALHLVAWVCVGCETWLILRLIDAPVGLAASLVIDSLLSGLRSMAFMVPQALGVQEGGYVLLGALFGVSPESALALSLIRRARDIVIGAPALALWQLLEGTRVLRAPE